MNEDGVTNACNWNDTSGDIRGVDIEEALKGLHQMPVLSCPNGEIADKMKSGEVIAGISGVWDVMNAKKRGELTMEHVNCQLIHAPEEKCRWLHLRDIK